MSGRARQGWHPDPFGVHGERYFSADGQPTKLVRDRGAESYDEPPSRADEVGAAMARMSAAQEPPGASPPHAAYPYGSGSVRGPRRRPSAAGIAVSGIILAGAVAVVLVAQTMTRSSKSASTPGVTDVAFVTQAATRTLQQHTADVVLSAGAATGGNPAAALVALENRGIAVHALGAKVVGGISCTGYTVTPPGTQEAVTIWINPQHLVREISVNATVDILSGGASASTAPTGTAAAPSVDLTMDFSYSAAPLHVTAPPAASTVSFDTFLEQLGQNPALKQLEQTSAS